MHAARRRIEGPVKRSAAVTRTRRTRTWLLWIGAIVIALGVVVALLPAIASIWPGPGIVRDLVTSRLAEDASVAVGDVTLRWAGPHVIRNITVRDPDGTVTADLDVTLDTTFLKLALSRVEHYKVTVSGEVTGEMYENGAMSFARLLPKSAEDAPKQDEPDTNAPRRIDNLPMVDIELVNFTARLADHTREPVETTTFALSGAAVSLAPGRAITFDATGAFPDADQPGQCTFGGSISGLIAADGAITPGGATLSLKAHVGDAPLPGVAEVQRIVALDCAATSDDITERIDIDFSADMALLGPDDDSTTATRPATSTLRASVTLHRPIDANLNVTVDAASITGRVQGRSVAAGLLQPWVAQTPIVVRRDIGRSLDFEADITAGDDDASDRRAVTANAQSDNVDAELAGEVNPTTRAMDIASLTVTTTLHPELFRALADDMAIAAAAPVTLTGAKLHVPGLASKDEGDRPRRSFAQLAGTLELTSNDAIELQRVGDDGQLHALATLSNARLAVDARPLATAASIDASTGIDTGTLTVNGRVGNIFIEDEFNRDWSRYQPDGTITLRDLPADAVARRIRKLPDAVSSYLIGAINADVTVESDDGPLTAEVNVHAPQFTVAAAATRHADGLRIDSANLNAEIRPELLAELQADREDPIGLSQPFAADIHLVSALELPADADGIYRLPAERLTLAIDTPEPVIFTNVPALVEPLELRNTSLHVMAPLHEAAVQDYALVGAALWHTQSTDRTVGDIAFEVNWPAGAAGATEGKSGRVSLSLQQLSVRRLERAIGREVDSIAQWIGAFGEMIHIAADVDPQTYALDGRIEADLRQLAGTFDFQYAQDAEVDIIELSGSTSTLSFTADALNSTFNMTEPARPASQQAGSAEPDSASVSADVPAQLQVNALRAPLALLNDRPIDPARVQADLTFTAGPLVLAHEGGHTTNLSDLHAQVRASDLRQPVTFTVRGAVRSTDDDRSGQLRLDGSLSQLLTEDNRVALAQGHIDLTATGSGLPTAIADGVGSFDGLLVAAIGAVVRGELTADDLSRDTGSIRAALEAPNAALQATLLARGGKLRAGPQRQLVAELELTPELRDRILQFIHPIFADVRQVQDRIVLRMTDGGIPLDGNIRELDADLRITVGELELTSGSLLLGLLRLGDVSGRELVHGRIDPIEARIRNGVLRYERFSTSIDKYVMNWSGSIDLKTREVNLKTELPLDALGQTIQETEAYVKDVVVPIRGRGVIGDVTYEIDPSFDLAEVLGEAALRKLLEEAFDGSGNLPGRLFNRQRPDDQPRSDAP